MGKSALVSWVDFEAPHLWHLISQADLPLWTTGVGGNSLPITGKTQMLKGPPGFPGFVPVPWG